MIVTYESDPEAIRWRRFRALEPDGSNTVLYEFIRMLDSTGFGDYTETGIVIPCTYRGEAVNFTAQMYLDCEPPISGGREIWGFPSWPTFPSRSIGRHPGRPGLEYAGQPVALASMAYKAREPGVRQRRPRPQRRHLRRRAPCARSFEDPGQSQADSRRRTAAWPSPGWAYNLADIHIKGGWHSPARLHLIPTSMRPWPICRCGG